MSSRISLPVSFDELGLDVLDFLALAADDDAGAGGVDLDADAVGRALDEDARHGGLLQLLHQGRADQLVLERGASGNPSCWRTSGTASCGGRRGGSRSDWFFGPWVRAGVGVAVRKDDADVRHLLAARHRGAAGAGLEALEDRAVLDDARSSRSGVSAERLLLFSAFAIALFSVLAIRRADLRGMRSRSDSGQG